MRYVAHGEGGGPQVLQLAEGSVPAPGPREVLIEVAFAGVNRILARNLAMLGLVAGLALAAAWVGGNLFIVRQIVLAHGGSVIAESADGTTRFTVTLPKR